VNDPRTQWPKWSRIRKEDKFIIAGFAVIATLGFIDQNFVVNTNATPDIVFDALILGYVMGSGLIAYGAKLSISRWQKEKKEKRPKRNSSPRATKLTES
jgi:hypothetical protein